jgi:thiamine pyrophosphokinase
VAERGGNAVFNGDSTYFTVIKNSSIKFLKECTGNISVFAHSKEAKGVTEKGLLYEINNETLSPDYPLGVSNKFTGNESTITVTDGALCIMWEDNNANYFIGGYHE